MIRYLVASGAAALLTSSAGAQQGAFNMGQLTATVSQDATTQSEAKRARKTRGSSNAAYKAQIREICATYRGMQAQYGSQASDPELNSKCGKAGF